VAPANRGLRPGPRSAAAAALDRPARQTDGIAAAFNQLFAERGVDTTAPARAESAPAQRIVLVRRDADGERSFGGLQRPIKALGFADQAIEAAAPWRRPWGHLLKGPEWLLIGHDPLASPASAAALQLGD